MLTHLAARHRVHLACFVDDKDDFAHTETLRSIVKGECLFVPLNPQLVYPMGIMALLKQQPITTSYFASNLIERWLTNLFKKRKIDCAVVFSSAMAPFLLDRKDFSPGQVVLDLVDVDSDKWAQYAQSSSGPKGWLYAREAERLLELERRAARQFHSTILVSPFEAQTFARLAPESSGHIHNVPNGVDHTHFSPQHSFPSPFPAGQIPVVMTGAMDYRPNIDGAVWFAQDVLPLVLQTVPNAHFYIVGSNPPRSLSALANKHITITGRVPDIRPYIAHASVAVAPLRIARGVQNKVLEAMAMEKPVVATLAASRALDVTPGSDLLVEDSREAFAAAVVEAARGSARDKLARNGRIFVERHHDWARNLAYLDALLERAAAAQQADVADYTAFPSTPLAGAH